MAKTEDFKSRGAALVDDEPDLLRPAPPSRSRVEKEFLPNNFTSRYPAKRTGGVSNGARIRRRVSQHKGLLPVWTRTRWGRIALLVAVLAVLGLCTWAVLSVRYFFEHDPRFRIDSSASIQTIGNSELTRADLLSVFGSDIGRNIFFVPLAKRQAELEQIPWVEHATVMRILPNQLRVKVRERTPVAFARVGDRIKLVDASGVLLDMPPAMMTQRHYSFPVVTGINPSDPPQARAERMALYMKFMSALNTNGQHLAANISEINLSDPEDLRVTVPVKSTDLLLHFGNADFLKRYQIFQSHLVAWEQQYPNLAGVDLRYENEVVLTMATPPAPAASTTKSKTPAKRATARRSRRTRTYARRHDRRVRR